MSQIAGFIDPHIHSAPEHIPRLLNDIELVRQAREAGMRGVLIKSHTTLTADRAAVARSIVPGIQVWGGLVLNDSVGGWNAAAVETAIAYGASEIWMPTIDAANHRSTHGQGTQGLSLESDKGQALEEILSLIARHDLILGTGHLSVQEILRLVQMAKSHKVRKILITHPEAPFVNMPLQVQKDLAAQGCLFERTWVFTTPALGRVLPPAELISAIQEVGFESTVLASDMGQVGNPAPVDGFRAFVSACLEAGFSQSQVETMAARNIGDWLI